MNLLQALMSPPPTMPPQRITRGAVDHPAQADDDDRESGCGWFDSSHDLRAGLQVCEHAANDAVLAELPLAMWLELQHA
ncbi:MAG TPA: hypothetical protein VK570_17685 [Rubrivivax sp.]|jgi:hypothetical protein|nr:hypothetical protein [Rubrivivax sp.]